MSTLLALEAEADLAIAQAWREALAEKLAWRGAGASQIEDLLLAMSEIFANIVLHAQPPARHIGLRLEEAEGRLRLVLEDDGGPFLDFAERAAKACAAGEVEDNLEEAHGRGLKILLRLFPKGHYQAKSASQARNRFLVECAAPIPVAAHPQRPIRTPSQLTRPRRGRN
jgi:anti-sigma regulatory factor (Ser/Thr protein kinase)